MATTALNFWTPVRYEQSTLLGTIDDYFHLKGDVAIVTDSKSEVNLEQADSPLWLTIIKVISYATLIIPALLFVAKCVLRAQYQFHIPEQAESENETSIYRCKVSSKDRRDPVPVPSLSKKATPLVLKSEQMLSAKLQALLREPVPNRTPAPLVRRRATPLEPDEILPHDFQNTAELLRESQDFYNNYSLQPALSFATIDTEKLPIQELIKTLLNQYNGLCIGESHGDSSPKYFLSANMSLFRELGVDVLYIEGYEGLQQELDQYSSGNTSEMPNRLKNRISSLHSTGPGGYTEYEVLEACKEAGIRIMNIDSDAAYRAPVHNSKNIAGILRASAMNYQAKLIIDRDRMLHKPRKCLIYAGVAHTSAIAGVPGLGQIYQFPTLAFQDSLQNAYKGASKTSIPAYTIKKNVVERSNKRKIHYDFHILMEKPLK